MNNDSQRRNSPARIVTFIAAVMGGTAAVIVLTYWITNSWATGTTSGVIAGVLSASMYPVLFRKR
ncbi:hypothetical protein NHF46_07695 [Arthrobacter alpinus]|uniref:hypothetical protein n=1 Tax=Arthrobacter alpinus TaxID=656366 RepID=UPI000AB4AB9B|nr:hypothetical protein [Arthrobacter alpinus]MDD0857647.1 hypothetical protein [Arthrobacter alpinus]